MSIKGEFRKRAFTLVELLIVVIIIAILAVIAIPRFTSASQRSKEAALHAELKLQRNAIAVIQADIGCVPNQTIDLALPAGPATCFVPSTETTMTIPAGAWHGPYLSTVDNDPVSAAPMAYVSVGNSAGTITSSAPGTDSNGIPYSSY